MEQSLSYLVCQPEVFYPPKTLTVSVRQQLPRLTFTSRHGAPSDSLLKRKKTESKLRYRTQSIFLKGWYNSL